MKPKQKILGICLALAMLVPAFGHAWSLTHLQGGVQVGVGNATGSIDTLIALTGTSTVGKNIALSEVFAGYPGALGAPVYTSQAASVYFGSMTGATNTAALICPAVNNVTMTVQSIIPGNFGTYWNIASLQLLVHYSNNNVTWTGGVSITANVYDQSIVAGLTSTVESIGTTVFPPINCGQVPNWVSLTNAQIYNAGDLVTWQLNVSGTQTRVEILAIKVTYKPWGLAVQ